MPTPLELLRLVLDPVRLAVLGHAAVGPVWVPELAKALGVPERKVLEAAGRLREAGLLDADLRLRRDALRELAGAIASVGVPVASVATAKGEWSEEEATVLARFFSGDRLTSVPSQRSKRLVVLERLALEFEPGIPYQEWQVDTILRAFHEDHASLRRYLVDEGFLDRERGVYVRSGGRV